MKSKMSVAPILLGGVIVASSATAVAGDSVIVGGIRHTCSNTCVVTTTSPGIINVRDCCGGQVRIQILPTRPPED